jgi:hypothetical protein
MCRVDAAGKLDGFVPNLPVLKESDFFAHALPGSIPREAVADFVFNESASSAEFAEAVEIPQER